MKRTLIVVVIAIFVLSLSVGLVACTPAKIDDIVGTYRLVTDTTTAYEQDTVDNIQTYEKDVYLVLTGSEKGYYVYKDKDTPVFAREVKLEYYKNENDKVTSITFRIDENTQRSLLVNANKDVMLVSRWTAATKINDAYDIEYKKISNDVDLSAVKKVYGDLTVFGYNLYRYDGLYSAELYNGLQKNFSEYIYKYYSIDSAACKATLYYALKSDKKAVVTTDLDVSFTQNEENGILIGLKIGEDYYDVVDDLPRRTVSVIVSGETIDAYENLITPDVETVNDEYFENLIAEYEKSLTQE